MSYQPYPDGLRQPDLTPEPEAAPRSVQTATRLMYTGAALSLIEILLTVLTTGTIRATLQKATSRSRSPLTHAQINTLVTFDVVGVVIVSVIAIGLWLWMAWACGRGRSWARIVSSVLFGLNTLFALLSLARPSASIGLVLIILVWLAGLGAIVFLWQRPSSGYFQARA